MYWPIRLLHRTLSNVVSGRNLWSWKYSLFQYPGISDNIYGEESNLFTNTLGETVTVEIQDNAEDTSELLCESAYTDRNYNVIVPIEVRWHFACTCTCNVKAFNNSTIIRFNWSYRCKYMYIILKFIALVFLYFCVIKLFPSQIFPV